MRGVVWAADNGRHQQAAGSGIASRQCFFAEAEAVSLRQRDPVIGGGDESVLRIGMEGTERNREAAAQGFDGTFPDGPGMGKAAAAPLMIVVGLPQTVFVGRQDPAGEAVKALR